MVKKDKRFEEDEDEEETEQQTKNSKKDKFKAHTVFGISEEKAKDLARKFRHEEIDHEKFTDVALALDINNSGELGYKIFLWSTRVAKNDDNVEGFIIGRIRR